jgi:hypothetical protein
MELGWIQLSSARTNKPRLFDAHRDDAKRFVVRADEILIAFLELEAGKKKRKRGQS